MPVHSIVDTINSFSWLLVPIVVLVWRGVTSRMHQENQDSLTKINNSIASIGYKIDNHIELDDFKHENFDRRITKLEK